MLTRHLYQILCLTLLSLALTGCPASSESDAAEGDESTESTDPKKQAAEIDAVVEKDLRTTKCVEARAWCAAPKSMGFEVGTSDMLQWANEAYAAGAVKVWVTNIDEFGGREISASMAIEIPQDPAARTKLFAWMNKLNTELFEISPIPDVGQKYFEMVLD